MKFDKVIIIGPGFEQRIAKIAYSLKKFCADVSVWAEVNTTSKMFYEYIETVKYKEIPISPVLKKFPFGIKRNRFIIDNLTKELSTSNKILLIARDVTYGYLVGKIINKLNKNKIYYIVDIADNYDLLYNVVKNPIIKIAFKFGFNHLFKKSIRMADGIFIVSPVNEPRIRKKYLNELKDTNIFLLRNLPIKFNYFTNTPKIRNSIVYVGRIDEISRDPFYILDKLKKLNDYTIHFYSLYKADTLSKIKEYSVINKMDNRIFIHEKVPYDMLSKEISKYEIGIIPHKRNGLTDYTVPNKIYDYKSAGVVTVMSDNPALVAENKCFGFGLVYSKSKDDFEKVLNKAKTYILDMRIEIPTWCDSMDEIIEILKKSGRKSL